MAHIPDGVLAAPVLMSGAVVSAALLAIALKRLPEVAIPKTAVLAAVFFVASLVHIPVGPTSVHPLLNGLMGLVLGWAAVPAIFVGLLLQAVFFGFGGITTLGVNVVNIALPALLAAWIVAPRVHRAGRTTAAAAWGAVAGAGGVLLTAALVSASLAASGSEYVPALGIVFLSYAPLAVVEAVLTAATVGLLKQVKPDLLDARIAVHA